MELQSEASDSLLVRINAAGDVEFAVHFGDGGFDLIQGAPIEPGRYLMVGTTSSWGSSAATAFFGVYDATSSQVESLHTMGTGRFDALTGVRGVGQGRFVAAGRVGTQDGGEDAWLMRLDPSNPDWVEWSLVYEAPGLQRVLGAPAVRTDGGLAVVTQELADADDANPSPAVLLTDGLGGISGACPALADAGLLPQPVAEVPLELDISTGAVTFTREVLTAQSDPMIDLEMGAGSALCEPL